MKYCEIYDNGNNFSVSVFLTRNTNFVNTIIELAKSYDVVFSETISSEMSNELELVFEFSDERLRDIFAADVEEHLNTFEETDEWEENEVARIYISLKHVAETLFETCEFFKRLEAYITNINPEKYSSKDALYDKLTELLINDELPLELKEKMDEIISTECFCQIGSETACSYLIELVNSDQYDEVFGDLDDSDYSDDFNLIGDSILN